MERRTKRTSGVLNRKLGIVLIVDDDHGVARAVQRFVPDTYGSVLAHSVSEARELLAQTSLIRAAVIDLGLPDGSGIEIVKALRTMAPDLPVLVLTAILNGALVNEVNALGAQYVCKPDFARNLVAFFAAIGRAPQDASERIAAAADALHLTNREREILAHATGGVPRGRLAEVMGISENTLKKYVRAVLRKTNQSSLSEAVWFVRNETWQEEQDDVG